MIDSLDNMTPTALVQLFDLSGERAETWSTHDLRAMLAHQLSLPLVFDRSGTAAEADDAATARPQSLKRLADLLEQPHPPLADLVLVKTFAKVSLNAHPEALPEPIALVLYYAAIVAARLRLRRRITQLDDAKLLEGIRWALEQPWVDPPLRQLFEEGLVELRRPLGLEGRFPSNL